MSRQEQLPDQPAEEHFLIPQKGLKELSLMLDGNGVRADQVRLARHETIVHQVPGEIIVVMKPDISIKQVKGKNPVGTTLGDKQQVLADAEAAGKGLIAAEAAQKEIIAAIAEKPGLGFGVDPFKFKIKSAHKEYSVVDTCQKCHGATMSTCNTCAGTGSSTCTGCTGNGFTQCSMCYGSGQFQKSDGSRPPCTKCAGVGRAMCLTCQGQKILRCAVCSGQGKIGCSECDRSGFWTHVFDANWHAEALFVLDRAIIPPEVLEVVDILGVKQLATEAHAEILKLVPEQKEEKLIIPFVALLPIAQIEFTLEGKNHPAVVAGLNGRVVEVEALLDKLIKPGISALLKLSKGPMAVSSLMATACRFKATRQVLAGLAHHTKGHVYKKMVKEYPLVLTENYAKATVTYAQQAILALSEGPRWRGFAAGCAAAAVIAAGYFLSPIRTDIAKMLASQNLGRHLVLVDVLIWALGYVATVFAIKFSAAAGLKKLLPDSVQVKERGLPAAGRQGIIGLPVTFVFWLGAAFFATIRPEWLSVLLKKVGLG